MKYYKKDQHFLIDKRVLRRIVDYGRLSRSDTVLEIGAGYGNLTEELAKKAGKVIAIEADPEFSPILNRLNNVEVVIGDALEVKIPCFNKVISNLPYSISSSVTFKLLAQEFDVGILMYQREFAERLAAQSGSRDYGRLSIAVQHKASVDILEVVSRNAFSSPPAVDSAIVQLIPRIPPYTVTDEDFYMKLIKVAFSQRRKKLRNALLNNSVYLGIDETSIRKLPGDMVERRPETLSPAEFTLLANLLIN